MVDGEDFHYPDHVRETAAVYVYVYVDFLVVDLIIKENDIDLRVRDPVI